MAIIYPVNNTIRQNAEYSPTNLKRAVVNISEINISMEGIDHATIAEKFVSKGDFPS